MGSDNQINRLEPTDAISPEVLTGFHYVPLEIDHNALPPEKDSSIEEILAKFCFEDAPNWMQQFPEEIIIKIRKRFRSLSPIFTDDKSYRFNINCRLNETTFVGKPVGQEIPIFKVLLGESVLLDESGNSFISQLDAFIDNDVSAEEDFAINVVQQEDLDRSLKHHSPKLVLLETWRIISAYERLSVGSPAGSVTLTPDEERTITIKQTTSSKLTTKETLSVLEKVSSTTEKFFQTNYDEIKNSSDQLSSNFSWSASSKVQAGKNQPAVNRSDSGERSRTISESLNITLKTLDKVTSTQNRLRDVKITHDYETIDTEEIVKERKIALKNKTGQGITYVYYYLDYVYLVCVDLADVELIYTGETVAAPFQVIPLTSKVNEELNSIISDTSYLSDVRASIDGVLKERYSEFDILEEDTEGLFLKAPLDDDVNTRIHSRQALFGERRKTGALPISLETTKMPVKTPNLHVVPHLSQYSLPQTLDSGVVPGRG